MKKIKVLIGKPGLDGHDRGAKVISKALMEAGFEVIYTGIRRTPEEIVKTAIEEDVDAVGLSCLSGAHLDLFKKVSELLKKRGKNVLLFGGGIIPKEDVEILKNYGFKKIFTPDASVKEIIEFLNDEYRSKVIN